MKWFKQQEIDAWVFKAFLIFTLLLPAFYSPHTDVYQSAYYEGFSWAYLCLVIYMGIRAYSTWQKGKRFSSFAMFWLGLLFLYNAFAFYFNHKYLHWYWEQINTTVTFLMFGFLIWSESSFDDEHHDNIRFLIHCIVISNLGSIVCYLLGYTKFMICNNQVLLYELPSDFYETRHYWIYSHKSEYALMLVAFVALFVAYREKFKNRITFVLSIAVLLACLYLTHSWTGIAGVVLIFIGKALDSIEWKHFHFSKKYILIGAVFLAVAARIGYKVLGERDVFTLGHRTQIWPAAIEVIKRYPQGWGMRFGESAIEVMEGWTVNNAHNVFLNQILRFSVPVGICFTLLFLIIVIYSLVKSKSFLAAGMWISLLISLNMDYSLMSLQMALLFLIVYLVCINRQYRKKYSTDG